MIGAEYERSKLMAHILTWPGENPNLVHEADAPRIIVEDSALTKLKKKLRKER